MTIKAYALSITALLCGSGCMAMQTNVMAAAPAPAPSAVVYNLYVCLSSGHGCEVVSTHPSSGACNTAAKAFKEKNPGKMVVCNKRAY